MGLAASQARLIALEARMTDTEYEGQQINQERLTLSNKMNEIYAQLTNMEVPTPPSKIDYAIPCFKGKLGGTVYTAKEGEDGKLKFTKTVTGPITKEGSVGVADHETCTVSKVANMGAFTKDFSENGGSTIVVTESNYKSLFAGKNTNVDKVAGTVTVEGDSNSPYKFGESEYTLSTGYNQTQMESMCNGRYILRSDGTLEALTTDHFVNGTLKAGLINNIYENSASGQEMPLYSSSGKFVNNHATKAIDDEFLSSSAGKEAFQALQNSFPEFTVSQLKDTFTVVINGGSSYSFVKKAELDSALQNKECVTIYQCTQGEYEKDVEIDGEPLYDTNGNVKSISVGGKIIEMTTATDYDEFKYEEARRQYESDKSVYDQKQNELNHQTSIYQRQDKQLELKLTRLDNERNALNTEIESVKKVIQDAIDKGFKTFSG